MYLVVTVFQSKFIFIIIESTKSKGRGGVGHSSWQVLPIDYPHYLSPMYIITLDNFISYL
ncbi:uncharacterized protein An01g03980 [Aspergillus niger]|uniref:Contig An01c0120, genomic contig n=2 Tax=Aspergillus niger TaxID=5061 RepID=A2Q8D7_ASPNC|nr:uncharacterized protein An01g03980 [Aspergillus niger]CAK36934.1 unnamed protein product [Aspergillus niger]